MQALGPIGSGTGDGKQRSFNETPRVGDLSAIRIKAGEALHKIKTYTRSELVQLPPTKLRARKNTHWVILEPNEYVAYVEIRAMAWVDGLRIHTNLRSTRWYGGFSGQLQALRPHCGKINGFFGSRGDRFVGRLGVYCSSITERTTLARAITFPSPATVFTMCSVGGGETSKPYRHFDSLGTQLGAIVLRCGDFVESIRVVSSDVHTRSTLDNNAPVYPADEHVFALRHDEYLTQVTVRSGAFVDAIQFHTNQRSSEWFGGKGGTAIDEFVCAPGFRICGLYGRVGDSVVDMLGVHMCENSPTVVKLGPVGLGKDDGQQNPFSSDPWAHELGAILVDAGAHVSELTTYTRDDYAKLSQREVDQETEQGLEWFVLETNEYITAIEVHAAAWVNGVRFHTNETSSAWYGGEAGQLHRLEAKVGHKIFGLFGTLGDSYTGQLGALTCAIDHP